jgi:excisionase family DNA binding protein
MIGLGFSELPEREEEFNSLETDMDSNEKWYSVKEVSGILRVDRETVRRWILNQELEALVLPFRGSNRIRIYQSRRVSETALTRFIESRLTTRTEYRRRRAA